VLPAQAVRGEHSFARIDGALDDLRDGAPQTFWRRLTVGVTLDAGAVPYLSASFSYFLGKQLGAISISPAAGQAGRWTPDVVSTFERELKAVYAIARVHFEKTGAVPLVAFRKSASGRRPRRQVVVRGRAAGPRHDRRRRRSLRLPDARRIEPALRQPRPGRQRQADADGQRVECGVLGAPRRTARAGPHHGSLPHRPATAFIARPVHPLSALPRLQGVPGGRALGARPRRCAAHSDYLCAFNWTLMGLRKRFPAQPPC